MRALRPAFLAVVAIICISGGATASEKRCVPGPDGICDPPAIQLASLQLDFRAPAAEAPRRPRTIAPERPRGLAPMLGPGQRRLREIDRRLLLREIAQTKRLFAATPSDSPDHPRLQRRLAEAHVELARGLERDRQALETGRQNAAEKLEGRVKRARRRGIAFYRALVDQHPGYCTTPRHKIPAERGCLDEILFFLGHELALDGDRPAARAAYLRLVQGHPRSKYLPAAHLAFGELLFEQARSDAPRWAAARAAYEKVVDAPLADDLLRAYARYKLGHVHWNMGDHPRALDAFKKVVEAARRHPRDPQAEALLAAARRDLVPVFAQTGAPERAHAFFASLSDGAAATRAMLEDLGVALLDRGHFAAAIALYGNLVDRFGDARACRYRAAIAQATMATRAADRTAITRALDDLVAHHASIDATDPDERLVCANLAAALVTETAMAWHVEAAGTGGLPGTDDAATLDAAEHLYQLAETAFDPPQWNAFRFPRLARHDWPTLARVHRAHALLRVHRRDWQGCGEGFSRAYEADPKGPEAAEVLHVSALCWQQAYLVQRAPARPSP